MNYSLRDLISIVNQGKADENTLSELFSKIENLALQYGINIKGDINVFQDTVNVHLKLAKPREAMLIVDASKNQEGDAYLCVYKPYEETYANEKGELIPNIIETHAISRIITHGEGTYILADKIYFITQDVFLFDKLLDMDLREVSQKLRENEKFSKLVSLIRRGFDKEEYKPSLEIRRLGLTEQVEGMYKEKHKEYLQLLEELHSKLFENN